MKKKKLVSINQGRGVVGSNEEDEHKRARDMQGGWQVWAKKKKRVSDMQGKWGCKLQRRRRAREGTRHARWVASLNEKEEARECRAVKGGGYWL